MTQELPDSDLEPAVQKWAYKALGYDEGTFTTAGREGWRAYTVTIAANNSRVARLRRRLN